MSMSEIPVSHREVSQFAAGAVADMKALPGARTRRGPFRETTRVGQTVNPDGIATSQLGAESRRRLRKPGMFQQFFLLLLPMLWCR